MAPSLVQNKPSFIMCEAKRAMVITGIVSVIVVIIITSIYFSSGSKNEINMGQGNDVANIKESTGIHLLEVDASNSESWSWLEIGFVILALKMGLFPKKII